MLLAVASLGVISAPAQAITRARADRVALGALHGLRYSPIVLFRLPGTLGAGTRITIADAGRAGSRRLPERAWLYWVDLQPETYFEHAGSLVVVAQRNGRILVHEPTMTWPLIDGRPPAFLRSARAYNEARYRALARGGYASAAAARAAPPLIASAAAARAAPSLIASAAAARAAPPLIASAAAGSGARCMIVVGPPQSVLSNPLGIWDWGGHLNDADQMAALGQRLGIPVRRAYNLSELSSELQSAPQQGCTDVLVFMTGEGSPVPFEIPAALRGLLGGAGYIGGNTRPNIELGPNGDRVYADQLAKALDDAYKNAPAGAKPDFTLMIQECFGGRMFDAVENVSGVRLIATSSPANAEAERGHFNGASPWVNGMTDGILQAAQDASGRIISWPEAVSAAFGTLKPTDDTPQLDVQGKIISRPPSNPPPAPNPCARANTGGGIDLLLLGDFFGQVWGSGEVTATSSGGSPAETASVGYDYASEGHFGPWPCGSTTTLTATPARGNHFEKWQSSEGLCAGAGPTCTVPITTTAHQITARFAPTVYQLSVNHSPDGIVTSEGGGGYVYPGIDCGSQPNGPTTPDYTECQSGAVAQRADDDLTRLLISADNPGPGPKPNGDAWGVGTITGCDSLVSTNNGNAHPSQVQCLIDMNSDRSVTVTYVDEGPSR